VIATIKTIIVVAVVVVVLAVLQICISIELVLLLGIIPIVMKIDWALVTERVKLHYLVSLLVTIGLFLEHFPWFLASIVKLADGLLR
jgi:hypothetical protein